jgi:DNA topoisomerase-2
MTKTIEQKYRRLSDVEHVLLRPGRYIGSVKPHTAETYVIDEATGKMTTRELTWNPGLLKLFDEIITNSVDHSKRPEGKHLDQIKVDINEVTGEISVSDNGGIPVVLHAEYNEYVPSLIFGYLRSGSNFDDAEESSLTGQNGEGSSLVSIFSTKFIVETSDGKKRFKQTWSNNMREKTKPSIIEVEEPGFTKITFQPDYAHLGTQLDADNLAKIVKRVYDVAGCNPKLKVYLNGKRIRIDSFKDYVRLYADEFEYDENDDWQVGITKSTNGFEHVSFVNATQTLQGGSHIDYVVDQVVDKLREHFKTKYKIKDIKPAEIKTHMCVFINARVVNPRYDSQTKETLITEPREYKTSYKVSERMMTKLLKSPIIESVLTWVEAKAKAAEIAQLKQLNKDTEKVNPRKILKLDDASYAGKKPEQCYLFIAEGDCIAENTLVRASDTTGILSDKPIGKIELGDLVWTHANRLKPVVSITKKVKHGIKLITSNGEIVVSTEHRLLAYNKIDDKFEWLQAGLLDKTIHQLVESSIVTDAMFAEVTDVTIDAEGWHELHVDNVTYPMTASHEISVFDMDDLSIKIIASKDVKPGMMLVFR